jgi:hypothetical protein
MIEPNEEQLAEWEEWLDERPPAVQEVARRLPPWKLYYLTSAPPQRVTINSYNVIMEGEREGEVVLNIHVGSYLNFVMFDRNVFDVPHADLVECVDERPWQEVPD